jgi:serpin B
MTLEEKIRQSGKRYFINRAPSLKITDILAVKKKPWYVRPMVIGSLGFTSVLSFALVLVLSLQSTQPMQQIDRDFSGLQNLNVVEFPNPLSRPVIEESALTSFALQTSIDLWDGLDGNQVYSPLSLYLTLGMILEASNGNTYEEIAAFMGIDSRDQLRLLVQLYYQHFYHDQMMNNQLLSRLRLHQGMFIQDGFPIEENFLQTLAQYYYAEMFSTDFSPLGLQGIADWINERTFDFLTITPEDLGVSAETMMALYQTYYLKANWKKPFDPTLHYEAPFNDQRLNMTRDQLYMRKAMSQIPLFEHEAFTLVGDYAYGDQTVYYLIPQGDQSLQDTWATYQDTIMAFTHQPSLEDVYLHIPKTKVTSQTSFKPLLENNGVTSAFTNEADFSNAHPNLFIESIQQQAGFALFEDGIEAAAYTEVDFEVTSSPNPQKEIRINESFIMLIVSEQGAISLMAFIQDLS